MLPIIPILTTERLVIRPFAPDDLDDVHRILDVENQPAPRPRAERAQFLEWTVRNYQELARLYQPPYGDRAVVERTSGELIGAVGLVPAYGPFGLLPYFSGQIEPERRNLLWPEFGLFYAVSTRHQRQGYATEASRALIEYVFEALRPRRIVATTSRENIASQRVMVRLGMRLERNPYPEPEWFQVVGVLENPTIP
ncbi:MAG TPA: GNAT family N-acetyltransferase [Anaerolineaceae bacterium]|nr:GNAT family N-acetyltransferase [Anaerolineaceae bacterium]